MRPETTLDFDHRRLDKVLHSRVRTAVMSALLALKEADFTLLKDLVGVTDGNLITHLRVLEEAGYIAHRKEGRGRNASSTYWVTEKGRKVFQKYIEALAQLVLGHADL